MWFLPQGCFLQVKHIDIYLEIGNQATHGKKGLQKGGV